MSNQSQQEPNTKVTVQGESTGTSLVRYGALVVIVAMVLYFLAAFLMPEMMGQDGNGNGDGIGIEISRLMSQMLAR